LEDDQHKKIISIEKMMEVIKETVMRKDRLLILLLSGILILVIALPVSEQKDTSTEGKGTSENSSGISGSMDMESYAAYLEDKLAEVLSQIQGVGQTKVMVTLQSSGEKIVEKDQESESESVQEEDSQGGSRTTIQSSSSQSTIYTENSGTTSGEPYVTKELTPVVEGVIVIAEGGDDPVAVQNITEAVQALFGVDTHKIKVMKSN
jgi:stage III sporulation protein AG